MKYKYPNQDDYKVRSPVIEFTLRHVLPTTMEIIQFENRQRG